MESGAFADSAAPSKPRAVIENGDKPRARRFSKHCSKRSGWSRAEIYRFCVRHTGARQCFRESDLYTTWLGGQRSTDLERVFFGSVDSDGRAAVEYLSGFEHPSVNPDAFEALIKYMTVPKLRTPKGLAWLAEQVTVGERATVLRLIDQLQQLYGAVWSECVWQIADASDSMTKFIISDHPVTVYNRELGPRNKTWCRGANDPDVRMVGSHTIFPLSSDKILILTNLSWVRNPYQSANAIRPNPTLLRNTVFNFLEIQTLRHLSEEELRQVNFIVKSRAYRYIAAGQEDWLYPEEFVSKSEWNTYGDGLLLMPDPRTIHYGGEVISASRRGRQ